MGQDRVDLEVLVAKATSVLDEVAESFVAGHGAQSAVAKPGNDFATEVDLAIERRVVEALNATTGIGVHGEEFGGAPLDVVLAPVEAGEDERRLPRDQVGAVELRGDLHRQRALPERVGDERRVGRGGEEVAA